MNHITIVKSNSGFFLFIKSTDISLVFQQKYSSHLNISYDVNNTELNYSRGRSDWSRLLDDIIYKFNLPNKKIKYLLKIMLNKNMVKLMTKKQ